MANEKDSKKIKKVTGRATDRLSEFLRLMDEEHLQELEISDGSFEVKLVRQSREPVYSAPAAPRRSADPRPKPKKEEVSAEDSKLVPVKSPLAGVFYRAPSPQAPPFVKEGDVVTPEKALCIIEAMKVLNEITGGVHGKIVRILVENGKPISSGQTLFMVEPS